MALDTLKSVKSAGYGDVRVAMTLLPENIGEVYDVYRLATELGVEFTVTAAHNSDIYFGKSDNVILNPDDISAHLNKVIDSLLRSKRMKDWLRAYHTKGLADRKIRDTLRHRCEAGKRYFFLAPNGDVYPCNVLDQRIGGITQVNDFCDLWPKEKHLEVRRKVKSCRRDCWMICNTRSLMMAHPVNVVSWVIRNKASRMFK